MVHEGGHVVHDGVDSGELTQEYHDLSVDDGAASTRNCKEVETCQATSTGGLAVVFCDAGVFHDEELFAVFCELNATNAFPGIKSLKGPTLVHEEARGLRHEEHSHQHNRGKDERGTEQVAPAAAFDVDEDGGHDISKDLTKSDVELIQGHKVAAVFSRNRFGHIYLRNRFSVVSSEVGSKPRSM